MKQIIQVVIYNFVAINGIISQKRIGRSFTNKPNISKRFIENSSIVKISIKHSIETVFALYLLLTRNSPTDRVKAGPDQSKTGLVLVLLFHALQVYNI